MNKTEIVSDITTVHVTTLKQLNSAVINIDFIGEKQLIKFEQRKKKTRENSLIQKNEKRKTRMAIYLTYFYVKTNVFYTN